jgi:hypothetical protein
MTFGDLSMKLSLLYAAALCGLCFGDDAGRLLRLDHYVEVHSTVPAISGQTTQIYVREVVEAGTVLRGGPAADRVALFPSTFRTKTTVGWRTSRTRASTFSRWT